MCTDPVVFPIVELTIELGVPILHHAGHLHYPVADQPHISDGGHLAELGRRYPEAMLICAHVCGGGDWEWTIKALRNAPNVFLDPSGSVTDDGVMEMAARVLGADRLAVRLRHVDDRRRGPDPRRRPERGGQGKDPGRNMEAILKGRKA